MKPHAADFDAEYVARRGEPIHDATDSTFTNAPPPFAASTGANAWVVETTPR